MEVKPSINHIRAYCGVGWQLRTTSLHIFLVAQGVWYLKFCRTVYITPQVSNWLEGLVGMKARPTIGTWHT